MSHCVQSATISSNNPFADILQTSDPATNFDLFDPSSQAADDDYSGGAASANNPFLFGAASDEAGDDVTAVTHEDPWGSAGNKHERIEHFLTRWGLQRIRTLFLLFFIQSVL